MAETPYLPGTKVFLNKAGTRHGYVISHHSGTPEDRYDIIVAGEERPRQFYASQIYPPVSKHECSVLTKEAFYAGLSAAVLNAPNLSSLYSLKTAKIDYIPYQFRPVLRFIHADQPRMLIADDVGVGKTIEAGLILQELKARNDVQKILIICPKPLITEHKWKNEMRRFGESFIELDSTALKDCIEETDRDGEWPIQYEKCILPYSIFSDDILGETPTKTSKKRRTPTLLELDPPPHFDLLIVDETHHIRNTSTIAYRTVEFFCTHADAVIFLTATPIQLRIDDLFTQLQLLRPDIIHDASSFETLSAPNPYIHHAIDIMRRGMPNWQDEASESLSQVTQTTYAKDWPQTNPDYISIMEKLHDKPISQDERIRLISKTEELLTFSGIINRTRRRDIGNFTIRKPETVSIPFSREAEHIYQLLIQTVATILSKIHKDMSLKFLMGTLLRQASSCIFGLVPLIHTILARYADRMHESMYESSSAFQELLFDASDEDQSELNIPRIKETTLHELITSLHQIIENAASLDTHDPKLERLITIIQDKQKLANNKIILFSTFRHTLSYLYEHLRNTGFRVAMIHGDTKDSDRRHYRDRFAEDRNSPTALDILLFSEVGCEGLDYQFCDCIINYDLPWNPMRIEQRIGRIDRNGQKSESIAIINMITPKTIDAQIYERCLNRIGVFQSALGSNEKILGDITAQIQDITMNYKLTPEQKEEKLQQLSDNQFRILQEEEKLENEQSEFLGLKLPTQHQVEQEIKDATNKFIEPSAIKGLINLYMSQRCRDHKKPFLEKEKESSILSLNEAERHLLLEDFNQLRRVKTDEFRQWETYLKRGYIINPETGDASSHARIRITTEPEIAQSSPNILLLSPLHPFVKQAANACRALIEQKHTVHLKLETSDVPAGNYPFAIYQWKYIGIRQDSEFKVIVDNAILQKNFWHYLDQADDVSDEIPEIKQSDLDIETLDAVNYQERKRLLPSYQAKNNMLYERKQKSLSATHFAKLNMFEQRLMTAEMKNNLQVVPMHESSIRNENQTYENLSLELKHAKESVEIETTPIIYGFLKIEAEQ